MSDAPVQADAPIQIPVDAQTGSDGDVEVHTGEPTLRQAEVIGAIGLAATVQANTPEKQGFLSRLRHRDSNRTVLTIGAEDGSGPRRMR